MCKEGFDTLKYQLVTGGRVGLAYFPACIETTTFHEILHLWVISWLHVCIVLIVSFPDEERILQ